MGTPSASSAIPANDFSEGAWLACPTCSGFIARAQRGGLLQYVVQHYIDTHPSLRRVSPVRSRPILLAALGELHDEFWRHREGPGRDLTPEEQSAEPAPEEFSWRAGPPRRARWLNEFGVG